MRHAAESGAPGVVKVGSSSLTGESGRIDEKKVDGVASQMVDLAGQGHAPILVNDFDQ